MARSKAALDSWNPPEQQLQCSSSTKPHASSLFRDHHSQRNKRKSSDRADDVAGDAKQGEGERGSAPPPLHRVRRPGLEFRAPSDGAWYGVRTILQLGALRVIYEGFTRDQDDWFLPSSLADASDVAALRARFRVRSPNIDAPDESGCRGVGDGQLLCVSCKVAGGDDGFLVKYYDAVLQSVFPASHQTVEEPCNCRFTVRWMEGPLAGTSEEVDVERVRRVRSAPVQDPVLNGFLHDAMAAFA